MLSDIIRHVYKKTTKLFGLQVLADGRWNDIKSLNETALTDCVKLLLENGMELECSEKHILIDVDGNQLLAKDSLGKEVKTLKGNSKVADVEQIGKHKLYDLTLAEDTDHLYYTNGILSHNCIICDEFAFLPRNLADKLFTSMYPTISSSKNGKFIIVSTPNGTDNLYYDIWQQANSKDKSKNLDGWKPFEMYWYQVPGHDEEWKKKQIAAIGEKRFAQEFNNEFLANSGSRTLIDGEILTKYKMKLSEYKLKGLVPKKQKIVSQDEKELFSFDMWHEFEPTRAYAASMDISEGVGSDSSVLYIWDVTDLRNVVMCARFSSNTISLVQFAYVARKMLALYGDPPLAAERNGVSAGTLDSLRITYGFQNTVIENKKGEPGIYSHMTVKERACIWCKEMMETRGFGFTIYDKDLIDEFGIFCKKDNKGSHLIYQALPGPDSHDDHVMAFVWLTYILHNDRVDTYFRLCGTFTSDLGKIYPQILQPYNSYTGEQWKKISSDPLYVEFMEYKDEVMSKCQLMTEAEKAESQKDVFKYKKRTYNPYFNDYDGPSWDSEPEVDNAWNASQKQNAPSLTPNQAGPSFYLF